MKLTPSMTVLDQAIQQWKSEYQCCCYRARDQAGHAEGCPLVALEQLRDELAAIRAKAEGHQCWFVCQACGVLSAGEYFGKGDLAWHKPRTWFERSDDDGVQTACSRECIDVIAAKTGKSNVVLPI